MVLSPRWEALPRLCSLVAGASGHVSIDAHFSDGATGRLSHTPHMAGQCHTALLVKCGVLSASIGCRSAARRGQPFASPACVARCLAGRRARLIVPRALATVACNRGRPQSPCQSADQHRAIHAALRSVPWSAGVQSLLAREPRWPRRERRSRWHPSCAAFLGRKVSWLAHRCRVRHRGHQQRSRADGVDVRQWL